MFSDPSVGACLSALLNANTQQHKTSVTTSPRGGDSGLLCFGVNTRVRADPSVLGKTVFLAPEAKPGTKVLSCTILRFSSCGLNIDFFGTVTNHPPTIPLHTRQKTSNTLMLTLTNGVCVRRLRV